MIFLGNVQEELGWRGYILEPMETALAVKVDSANSDYDYEHEHETINIRPIETLRRD